MDAQALSDKLEHIMERCTAAAHKAGRTPSSVQLIAVSKNHAASAVALLARYWAARANSLPPVFGESYLQEALPKIQQVAALLGPLVATHAPNTQAGQMLQAGSCPENNLLEPVVSENMLPTWHFIGHIQSRKAKELPGHFACVHSVDCAKVGAALQKGWQARVAGKPGGLHSLSPAPQNVLVQVNIGREQQKSGVMPEAAEALCLELMRLPGLAVQGLMCLPPAAATAGAARPYFRALASLRNTLQANTGLGLPHLSMGMSGDFQEAIQEGATLVRVGSSIFGERVKKE